ncbi:NAD(P)H-dependent oxidoreductase [bacterium]|nr:NAD(P)H-dependent oxidoreductase [bacterium]
MKILSFGGSNSSTSKNAQLAKYASSLFQNSSVDFIDLNDFEMPLFSVDTEAAHGPQAKAQLFLEKIKQCDALVISLAEHNGSYSVAFKNILDWSSRIDGKVFQNKPMLLMATSPGARGGAGVLEIAQKRFPFMGGNIKDVFSLPEFDKNFAEGKISNPELDQKLKAAVSSLNS